MPKRLSESVADCKDIYGDVLSIMQVKSVSFLHLSTLYEVCLSNDILAYSLWSQQSFVFDEKSTSAKLLSSTSEIGMCLFRTLETHFSMGMDDHIPFTGNNSLIQEQHKVLYEKLTSTITSLVLSQTPTTENEQLEVKQCSCENKVAAWSQLSRFHALIMILFSIMLLGLFYLNFFCILTL